MSLLGAWRARRALLRRGAPGAVGAGGSARLVALVDDLGARLGSTARVDDDVVHERRDGRLQLVGIDAAGRPLGDVAERVLRVAHEMELRHADAPRRRVLAVVLVDDPDPRPALERLVAVGEADADWRAARRRVALLVVGARGAHALRGGDHDVERAVSSACASARPSPSRPAARRS